MLLTKWLPALLLAGTAGCAPPPAPVLVPPPPPPAPPVERAFTCHGPAVAPPSLPPIVQVPAGKLEVAALDPHAAPPTTQEALWARRVRVVADGIPLGSLALALGDKLGVGVAVTAEVSAVRVFLSMPHASIDQVAEALREELRVWSSFDAESATLRFETPEVSLARRRASIQLTPLSVRLEPVREGASAEQMAATFCEEFASPYGLAAVMGRSVLLKDVDGNMNLFEEAAQAAGVLGDPPKKRQ